MTEKTIQGRLLVRADTSENWSKVNPILKKNELVFDSTAQKFKIGDGTTAWDSLGYAIIDYLPLSGGTMTGEIKTGQGDGYGIQLGTNGRINATGGGSTSATVCGINGENFLNGHTAFNHTMRGKGTRPTYNGNEIALKSDVPNDSNYAKLNGDNPFTGDNEFDGANTFNEIISNGTLEINGSLADVEGSTGTNGQVLTSIDGAVEWRTPSSSGGSSSYPVIDLDDNGLGLDDYPSGTTTQEKLNQIIQAGGFYYGDQRFAPLILQLNDGEIISFKSRTEYGEDGYSDVYMLNIYEDLSFETLYIYDYMCQDYPVFTNGAQTITGNKTFTGDIQMRKVKLPTTSNGTTYGYGTSGQVLMSNGSSAYWGTPSGSGDTSNFATLNGDNNFVGDNTFEGGSTTIDYLDIINYMSLPEEIFDHNGETGYDGQVLTYVDGNGYVWADPSGGNSSYPVIALDDSGSTLDEIPSGTTTQAKIDAIIQAGGFYYGDKGYAPLTVQNEGDHILVLGSRSDYAEEGYSDAYQIVIDKETLSFETFYFTDVMISGEMYQDIVKRNQFNNFTADNTFTGTVKMKKIQLPTTSGGSTYGTGSNGQVLMSNGSSAYWGTPSGWKQAGSVIFTGYTNYTINGINVEDLKNKMVMVAVQNAECSRYCGTSTVSFKDFGSAYATTTIYDDAFTNDFVTICFFIQAEFSTQYLSFTIMNQSSVLSEWFEVGAPLQVDIYTMDIIS